MKVLRSKGGRATPLLLRSCVRRGCALGIWEVTRRTFVMEKFFSYATLLASSDADAASPPPAGSIVMYPSVLFPPSSLVAPP